MELRSETFAIAFIGGVPTHAKTRRWRGGGGRAKGHILFTLILSKRTSTDAETRVSSQTVFTVFQKGKATLFSSTIP